MGDLLDKVNVLHQCRQTLIMTAQIPCIYTSIHLILQKRVFEASQHPTISIFKSVVDALLIDQAHYKNQMNACIDAKDLHCHNQRLPALVQGN